MKEKNRFGLITVGVAALFLAGFFLLVVFGAKSYRAAVDRQSENMHSRSLLSYLSTSVHAYDERGGVLLRESAEGTVLELLEEDTGYSLQIFLHEGTLMEQYALCGAEPKPETAQPIGETDSFLAQKTGSLLILSTDSGRTILQLRAEGGPEA